MNIITASRSVLPTRARPRMRSIRAVVFDKRGTLSTEHVKEGWTREALRRTGRDYSAAAAKKRWASILEADGTPSRLKDPTGNTSPSRHRETFYAVFDDAGLDRKLADALFEVDSDIYANVFAVDAAETLAALHENGYKIGVLTNIHVDVQPAFERAGLHQYIDAYVESGKVGVQKPNPAIFRLMLKELGTPAGQTLMVGDRSSRDGVANEVGMPTLLLPPLTDHRECRLHLVLDAAGL